jgi:hypothetical protein
MPRFILVLTVMFIAMAAFSQEDKGWSPTHASPNPVKMGKAFYLTLPEGHEANFLITSPSGKKFVLMDTDLAFLMSREAFMKARKIRLDTASQKGVIYIDGKRTVQKVFTEKGKYYLYLADNLETEIENTEHQLYTVTVK